MSTGGLSSLSGCHATPPRGEALRDIPKDGWRLVNEKTFFGRSTKWQQKNEANE